MKKFFGLFLVFSFIFVLSAYSGTKYPLFVKGGINFSKITETPDMEEDYLKSKQGFFFGGGTEIPLTENIFFETGLYYAKNGVSIEASEEEEGAVAKIEGTIDISYLRIPLLLKFKNKMDSGMGFSIFGGIYAAKRLSAKSEATFSVSYQGQTILEETDSEDMTDDVSSTDNGVMLGGEILYPLGDYTLTAGAQYILGLKNLNADETEEGTPKNRVLAIFVGIIF